MTFALVLLGLFVGFCAGCALTVVALAHVNAVPYPLGRIPEYLVKIGRFHGIAWVDGESAESLAERISKAAVRPPV